MGRPFITGVRTNLRGLYKEDLQTHMFDWTDDHEVTRYLFRGLFPNNLEQAETAYDQMINSEKEVELAIVDKDNDRLIGIAGLHSINWIARTAEFRILIGEKDYWGKGIGTEVTQMMCAYGFLKLNLSKIWLGVTKANEGALQTYVKSGFAFEGELRNEVYRNGKYYNVVRMSMLREEFEQSKSGWQLWSKIAGQFQA
ncbi:MAG: GNAT family N-acetyltransferase [Saprospiraceae bacterium]|nr:GNAT family N-acetyltransferase [Saprospiraceae bacterium]